MKVLVTIRAHQEIKGNSVTTKYVVSNKRELHLVTKRKNDHPGDYHLIVFANEQKRKL